MIKMILQILFYILLAFVGYAAGRIAHIFCGQLETPHHWIFGVFFMIVGLVYYKLSLGLAVFYFGAGFFVSDFKDFLLMRFYGRDKKGKKRFWDID